MQIIAVSIKIKKNHVLADKIFVVDFNSEVSEMSLSQYGWLRRKKLIIFRLNNACLK